MVEGNAFTNILKLISEQGYSKDVHVTVGSVRSPKPLSIIIDDLIIGEDDLIKSQTIQYLIDGMTGTIRSITGYEATDKLDLDIKKLTKDDKVLILIDGSNFYVIDRVV